MKKLSILTAIIMLMSLLAACSTEEAPSGDTSFPETAVATRGAAEVSAEDFYYYFSSVAYETEYSMNEAFADFMDEELPTGIEGETATYKELFTDYAIEGAMVESLVGVLFEEAGLELQPADIALIDEQMTSYETQLGGEESFNEMLAEQGVSREFIESSFEVYLMADKLTESLRSDPSLSDEGLLEIAQEEYVRVKHILIQSTDEAGNPVDEEDFNTRVDEVLTQLGAGADFDMLMEQYGEDPGMVNSPEGYVIDEFISFDPAFLEVAFDLEMGTYAVAEGVYGTHIIKRFPIEEAHLDEYYPDMSGYTVGDKIFYENANALMIEKMEEYETANELVVNDEVVEEMITKYMTERPYDADAHAGHDHSGGVGTEGEVAEDEAVG